MKRKIGNIVGFMFLLNMLFFIGTGFMCFSNANESARIGHTSHVASSHSWLENLSLFVLNVEVDEEETEEEEKIIRSINFLYEPMDISHAVAQYDTYAAQNSLHVYYTDKISTLPVYDLYCVYRI